MLGQQNADACRQLTNHALDKPTLSSAVHTQPILAQIDAAFRHPPNVANTLHGLRRIHQGARGRRTALFPSRKAGGAVPVESRLELAYAVLLERSSTVLRYRSQAVHIQLPAGQSAFPDFLVQSVEGCFELHEVKPSIAHLSHEYLARFELIVSLLQPSRVAFRLIDAAQLPTRAHLEWLMQRYVRGHLQNWTAAQIQLGCQTLDSHKPASFAEAQRHLKQVDLPVQLADYLSFHRHWVCQEEFKLRGAI